MALSKLAFSFIQIMPMMIWSASGWSRSHREQVCQVLNAKCQTLVLRSQDLPQPPVQADRFLRGLLHHLHPFLSATGQFYFGQQESGLHDGFERVAQIVGEGAQLANQFGGDFSFAGHMVVEQIARDESNLGSLSRFNARSPQILSECFFLRAECR